MNSTYEGKHMPPHHGDSDESHAAIEARDAADREHAGKSVGKGELVFSSYDEGSPTAVTRPFFRPLQ